METIISVIIFAVLFILSCLSLYRVCTVGKTSGAIVPKKEMYDMHFAPKIRRQHVRLLALLFFGMVLVVVYYFMPTKLGNYVFIERDFPNHKQTIHSNSSCPLIKKGYSVNEVHYYTYTPYVDFFCYRCFYESDAIKLTKGEK
nr:hypothetical protein [uncultured Prevotella sp.]